MFSNTRFAALALALAVSGLAGTAHAYDAFGGGSEHESIIRQSAVSAPSTTVQTPDGRFMVGSNAWTGDRDGLIRGTAATGFTKRNLASNTR